MKTLYITDLDGTLLNSKSEISPYSLHVINKLISKGEYFSYATARSLQTALQKTKGLNINIPTVVYNGVFIANPQTEAFIHSNFFDENTKLYIKKLFKDFNVIPNVYSFIDNIEKVSIIPDYENEYKKYYLDTRKGDKRLNFVNSVDELYQGNNFYYLGIGELEELQTVFDILKKDDRFHAVLQQELGRKEYWLDTMPKQATKANSILKLKEMLGCDRIVSFGDGLNDIEMFQISDECYAVENAKEELKSIATATIASNDNDGVAKWID